jgi:hypothetical protein
VERVFAKRLERRKFSSFGKIETMERLFQILAVALAGVAAFFLWRGNWDGTFVSAVFGAVCFFLSIRFQVGDRLKIREAEREREREELEAREEAEIEETMRQERETQNS